MEKIINSIFPPKCVFCGKVGDVFCEDCISYCNLLSNQRCLLCDKPSQDGETHDYCVNKRLEMSLQGKFLKDSNHGKNFQKGISMAIKYPTQLLSVFSYEKNVRECIRKSKYSSRLFMCLKRLSFEGVNILYEWGYNFDDFVAVSIPVSREKEKTRGFNQADIISKVFAKRFGLQIDNSILNRIKDKSAQHDLTRRDRFINIRGSFISDSKVKGKKVVLVDDICTSGATFLEASKVLYENGALEVKCFSLSKKL